MHIQRSKIEPVASKVVVFGDRDLWTVPLSTSYGTHENSKVAIGAGRYIGQLSPVGREDGIDVDGFVFAGQRMSFSTFEIQDLQVNSSPTSIHCVNDPATIHRPIGQGVVVLVIGQLHRDP